MRPLQHSRRGSASACRRWIGAAGAAITLLLVMTPQIARAANPSGPALQVAQLGTVPQPANDPFYDVPADIGHLPNGAILASRQVQALALAVPIPAQAWQVKYKTIDQHGNPSAYVTTILVPDAPWLRAGPRPLLSYQAAIDALSTRCAPSYVLRSGGEAAVTGSPTVLASNPETEIPNIVQALNQGWVVAVPDWEGPQAEWISGTGSAHGVLDGIRAARAFAPDGVSAASPIGMTGYSGGALATDWAMQMQPKYAPGLRFAGVALGGTPANLQVSIGDFAANPIARAAIPLLLAGLERSYPQWNLGQYLSTAGRTAVADSQNDCLADSLNRNAGVDPATYEAYPGAIFDNPNLKADLAPVSPLGYPGDPQKMPVLFYQSAVDELAPVGQMRLLAAKYCHEGLTVHVITSPAGEHIASVVTDFPIALSYIEQRFAGQPAADDCGSA